MFNFRISCLFRAMKLAFSQPSAPKLDDRSVSVLSKMSNAAAMSPGESIDVAWGRFEGRKMALRAIANRERAEPVKGSR